MEQEEILDEVEEQLREQMKEDDREESEAPETDRHFSKPYTPATTKEGLTPDRTVLISAEIKPVIMNSQPKPQKLPEKEKEKCCCLLM